MSGVKIAAASELTATLKSKNVRLRMQKEMKQPWQFVMKDPKSVPTMHCHPCPYDSSKYCHHMENKSALLHGRRG